MPVPERFTTVKNRTTTLLSTFFSNGKPSKKYPNVLLQKHNYEFCFCLIIGCFVSFPNPAISDVPLMFKMLKRKPLVQEGNVPIKQGILSTILENPKRLFLLDSAGALLTMVNLGFILTTFELYIGMPRRILFVLSGIAFMFSLYSLVCAFLMAQKWRLFLNIISIANLIYSCITAGLLVFFFPQLTLLGITYFVLEIIIIVSLGVFEYRVARTEQLVLQK